MRSSQLATLRAIQAGADTVELLSERLGIPYSSAGNRARILRKSGYVEGYVMHLHKAGVDISVMKLTAKARSLLARRAELDGEI